MSKLKNNTKINFFLYQNQSSTNNQKIPSITNFHLTTKENINRTKYINFYSKLSTTKSKKKFNKISKNKNIRNEFISIRNYFLENHLEHKMNKQHSLKKVVLNNIITNNDININNNRIIHKFYGKFNNLLKNGQKIKSNKNHSPLIQYLMNNIRIQKLKKLPKITPSYYGFPRNDFAYNNNLKNFVITSFNKLADDKTLKYEHFQSINSPNMFKKENKSIRKYNIIKIKKKFGSQEKSDENSSENSKFGSEIENIILSRQKIFEKNRNKEEKYVNNLSNFNSYAKIKMKKKVLCNNVDFGTINSKIFS